MTLSSKSRFVIALMALCFGVSFANAQEYIPPSATKTHSIGKPLELKMRDCYFGCRDNGGGIAFCANTCF